METNRKNSEKRLSDEELLAVLGDMFADVSMMSPEEIDEELRLLGYDPEELKAWTEAVVAKAMAAAKQRMEADR